MPDLLTHAFLAYTTLRVLSWRYDWLTTPYITAGMAGAFIPDIAKIELLVRGPTVEAVVGVPFSWWPIHQVGGTAICVLIGAVLVDEARRGKTLLVLSFGAGSHLIADALLTNASGRSYAVLWPLTRWHPPTPGLYLSTEPGPTIVTGVLAVVVWVISTRRGRAKHSADQ